MKIIAFIPGIVFILLGILSLLVAMAYWPMKGTVVACATGLVLIGLGIPCLVKGCRILAGSPKDKRNRATYY